MRKFSEYKEKAKELRAQAKTYSEIKQFLGVDIPKSTLSDWCSQVPLPEEYFKKIEMLNKINFHKGRATALIINKMKRAALLEGINKKNQELLHNMKFNQYAKITLAMLCLGEASKSSRSASFYFGNSNPKIIMIFLHLLKKCFEFDIRKVRCTVQCRADQNVKQLELFWQQTTGIPKKLFYPARIDPRTIGKITRNKEYKGVLRVDYFDARVRLELESLSDLFYNQLIQKEKGPEV